MKTVTEAQTITGTIAIWAIPQREWTDEYAEYRYNGKWTYSLHTEKCYERGAVMVCEQPISIDIPAGVDLRTQAIQTLENAIKDERIEHAKRINELQSQINQLLQLTYQPSEDAQVIEGSVEGVL